MTIVLISMFVRPKMLRVGHVLPKIPRQIPIICRHKPKTRGHAREMGEKGAKEKKGNPENKSPAEKIFFFYFYHIILLVFFYNRFLYIFYYYIFYYINFISFLLPIFYTFLLYFITLSFFLLPIYY
jgi:hypothetical protein